MISSDAKQISRFAKSLFRYAERGTYVSLRAFYEKENNVFEIQSVAIGNTLDDIINKVSSMARRCAEADTATVFCPPIATFKTDGKADEANLANGLALSVECDQSPNAALHNLELYIGPPTLVVASGGEWINPATAEVEAKLHLHWRLKNPTTTAQEHALLKRVRSSVTAFVGGDATNKPIVHPIRWPGSVHRKNTPRLAQIVSETDNEIDLSYVAEIFRDVQEASGENSYNGERKEGKSSGSNEDRTTTALVTEITSGHDYHAPIIALAMRYLKGGMSDAHVVLTLRGFMEAVPVSVRDIKNGAVTPGRWKVRYDDIPRAVSTARAKIGQQENCAPLHPISLSELLARPVPPVEEIIPGLVEKGIMTMLSGPGGRHKSRLLLQWLLCAAAEVKIFGRTVMPVTSIYLSKEDHADEVTRRAQAITKRLNLPSNIPFQYHDLRLSNRPLAILTDNDGMQLEPFYTELRDYLLSIPGHKFIGLDSCYNFLQFRGRTKIDEDNVKAALELLNRLCTETDATIIMLWHPSRAGQERGDASGWSVAWDNAPRARLSINNARNGGGVTIKDAFELKIEKRNNAPIGDPITLHWNDGALLPSTDLDIDKEGVRLLEACVVVALMAAKSGQPIQGQRHVQGWMLDEIEKHAGFRPHQRQIKSELSRAMYDGRLRYLKGTRHRTAGYYPPDIRDATDLAHEAKNTVRDEADND